MDLRLQSSSRLAFKRNKQQLTQDHSKYRGPNKEKIGVKDNQMNVWFNLAELCIAKISIHPLIKPT